MKKILIILPINTTEEIITKGFAKGFRDSGIFTIEKSIDYISLNDIQKINPDYIFGLNYSYLENTSLQNDFKSLDNINFIHYFNVEPTKKPELYKKLSRKNSSIFIWDKEFLSKVKNSYYLPLAVNHKLYKTNFSIYNYNISFIGKPLTEKRQKVLSHLIKQYGKINIFCDETSFEQSINDIKEQKLLNKPEIENYKKSYSGIIKSEEEAAWVYNSSKININIIDEGENNINYRVFETLASSGFLLTESTPEIQNNFESGRELETYNNLDDLTDKIEFYLNNLNIAQSIARKGRKSIVNNHTFKLRVEKILKTIEK